MRQRVLGTLTIGQAPRPDVVPIIDRHVAADVRRIHRGVLDGLTHAEIAARYRPATGEAVLGPRPPEGTGGGLSAPPHRRRLRGGGGSPERHRRRLLPLALPVILSNAVAAKAVGELLGG